MGWYQLFFQFAGIAEATIQHDGWAWLRMLTRGAGDQEQWIADLSRPGALTASLNWYRANLAPRLPAPRRDLPPVEDWRPAHCGDSHMRIAPNGTWFHQGRLIARPELVRLFSTILRKDEDGFVLVTPAEKLSIAVDDAPFLAVAAWVGCPLVTGNMRHFPAKARGGVLVLTPRQLVDSFARRP